MTFLIHSYGSHHWAVTVPESTATLGAFCPFHHMTGSLHIVLPVRAIVPRSLWPGMLRVLKALILVLSKLHAFLMCKELYSCGRCIYTTF